MPFILLIVGLALVGLAVYLAMLLSPLVTALGTAAVLITATSVLLGKGRVPRPVPVIPDDVASGRANLGKAKDWAWPGYLAAQWFRDLVAVLRGCHHLAQVCRGYLFKGNEVRLFPLALLLLTGIPAAFGAFIGTVQAVLAIVITTAVGWSFWGPLILVLRGYDRGLRALRRAESSCPHPDCYRVMPVPAYRCDGCRTVHRDIRPGLLGAIWRICGCGRKLPTTVFRASKRLVPECQFCHRTLRGASGAVTEIRIPVFGPVSAGKTRLVWSGLVTLGDYAAAEGGSLDFVDDASATAFQNARSLIETGGDTAKTPAGQLPSAITARFNRGPAKRIRDQAQLQLFDAAGEFFLDWDDNAKLSFLDQARGLVLVVDPFAIPRVRDWLGEQHADLLTRAHPASEGPEHSYQLTVQRLRQFQIPTEHRALAITVVKADLLTAVPSAQQLCDGNVRDWLCEAGSDNLVLSAERDFDEVRYFVVSSVTGVRPAHPMTPAAPLLWLMDRGGFSLSRKVRAV